MPAPPPPEHTRWKAGESGNPGGKAEGARNRLTKHFLHALADDFDEHGKAAIALCRETKPEAYIKAIAALCPKEIEVKRPLQDMDDEQLIVAVRALEGYLAARTAPKGADLEAEGKPACTLPTVQ